MMADAIRLLLFPAMMAFAASSDLLTMTISNRVSLILIGSFFVLALMWGMPPIEIGIHVGAERSNPTVSEPRAPTPQNITSLSSSKASAP